MKIKITKCKDPMMWYSDHIGEEYEVSIETKDYYIVRASDGFNNTVLKTECDIIN